MTTPTHIRDAVNAATSDRTWPQRARLRRAIELYGLYCARAAGRSKRREAWAEVADRLWENAIPILWDDANREIARVAALEASR